MTREPGHLDEAGRVCTAHPLDLDALLHLASVGARTPSFNHDIASKIQGVMMALDEIVELASGELKLTAETAQVAMAELNNLLQQNRALTKPPIETRVRLHDVITRAAMRVGVGLRGAQATCEVAIAVPLVTQALALVFDGAAGLDRRRSIELGVAVDAGRVELRFPLAPSAAPSGEALAIATWILQRERGSLHCGPQVLAVALPLAPEL